MHSRKRCSEYNWGPVTCSSNTLEEYCLPFEATSLARLRSCGAFQIGCMNCDEFAMGTTSEYSAYGPTRKPNNLKYVRGGSSGGSAEAVAAGTRHVVLGTDTGGSVRQPAAYCGVLGLMPTYVLVSRKVWLQLHLRLTTSELLPTVPRLPLKTSHIWQAVIREMQLVWIGPMTM